MTEEPLSADAVRVPRWVWAFVSGSVVLLLLLVVAVLAGGHGPGFHGP